MIFCLFFSVFLVLFEVTFYFYLLPSFSGLLILVFSSDFELLGAFFRVIMYL